MVKYLVIGKVGPQRQIVLEILTTLNLETAFNYIRDHYVPNLTHDLFEQFDADGKASYQSFALAAPFPAPQGYEDFDDVHEGDPISEISIIRFPNNEQGATHDLDVAAAGAAAGAVAPAVVQPAAPAGPAIGGRRGTRRRRSHRRKRGSRHRKH